jgi:methionine-rich copper-binding protein CopC
MRSPLLSALLTLAASPAWAHAVLIDSTPPPMGHVPAGPLQVTLRYNSRIDGGRSKLTLVRPDESSARLTQTDSGKPDILRAALDLTPGDYVIRWQVLAVDGHITRGNVPFTVDQMQAARPGAR